MKRRTLLLSPLPFVLSSLVNAKPIEKTETAEIVIIGAGAAGLFAAVAAKENGAGRVVLIEKNPSPFFSSTSYSAGSVNASGTLAQLKHGIQDIDGKGCGADAVDEHCLPCEKNARLRFGNRSKIR